MASDEFQFGHGVGPQGPTGAGGAGNQGDANGPANPSEAGASNGQEGLGLEALSPSFVALLNAWKAPQAAKAFRDERREQFVAPVQKAQAASLGQTLSEWQGAKPRAEFREELMQRFLRGPASAEDEAQAEWSAQPAAPVEGVQAPQPAGVSNPTSRTARRTARPRTTRDHGPQAAPWRIYAPLLVAAAALVLWVVWPSGSTGTGPAPGGALAQAALSLPGWNTASSQILLDGEPMRGSAEELEASLQQARRIAAPADQPLRVSFGRLFQVRLAEGSSLDLANFVMPQAGASANTSAEASPDPMRLAMSGSNGGFAIETGPDFKSQGHRLVFTTVDAEVEVTGTVFAIDCYEPSEGFPGGTCVCCSEGSVAVHNGDEVSHTGAGKSCFVFRTGDSSGIQPVPAGHEAPMEDLMQAAKPATW